MRYIHIYGVRWSEARWSIQVSNPFLDDIDITTYQQRFISLPTITKLLVIRYMKWNLHTIDSLKIPNSMKVERTEESINRLWTYDMDRMDGYFDVSAPSSWFLIVLN